MSQDRAAFHSNGGEGRGYREMMGSTPFAPVHRATWRPAAARAMLEAPLHRRVENDALYPRCACRIGCDLAPRRADVTPATHLPRRAEHASGFRRRAQPRRPV